MEKDSTPLPSTTTRDEIIKGLNTKSQIKSLVFDQCYEVFNEFKDVLGEISNDINEMLDNVKDRRVRFEYRDRGKFEAELKFADDVLVFSMHSDAFVFDRSHPIWKNDYVSSDLSNAYCGLISVYNFLSDSFKYNRMDDLGYMVARIFINKDKSFFVEGKRQKKQLTKDFGKSSLTRDVVLEIIESAIKYSLSFDLLVPPFDLVKEVSVEQINAKIESAKIITGKRMGYKYNSDDVLNSEQ